MQLPDESIEYDYHRLLTQGDTWTPLTELQAANFLSEEQVEGAKSQAMSMRSRVAADREMPNPAPKDLPLDAGFIDLPQKLLDGFRRKGDASELGQISRLATRMRENCDRVVILGIGGSYLGSKALFDALCHTYHNEMPAKLRMGKPRIYFEGNNLDNDAMHDLLELLENSCVDPDIPEERWGAIVISKSGGTLETATAYRVVRREAAKFYGPNSEWLNQLIVPITGPSGKLRNSAHEDGYDDSDILTIPDKVGGRYSVFTPVGLLPAAVMGLDIRALLLGAATMTKRFLEEPFERNPVLQYAVVNHLMNTEKGKDTRVMAIWSKKLESVGFWYDQLLSESLGKNGQGATPITSVYTRDLHSRGQQHQDGTRDKVINNLYVRETNHEPIKVEMAENNEDGLNAFSRKAYPDLLEAAFHGTNQAYLEAARPTADLILPVLSEHTIGQLLQMLMLATVVEGRMSGINPYGQPGVEAYKKNMMETLKASGNLPKGESA